MTSQWKAWGGMMALLSDTNKADAVEQGAIGAPSAWQAWRYRLKIALREPTTLIGVLTALLFTYLIVVPIISIVLDSVRVQFGHERRLGKDVGDLTMYYLDRAFFSPVATDLFWRPLANTLTVALGAISLSLVIGTVLAWLISRTDMFGRRWFATALIVPYMLPAWTFALAWTTLFKNRTVGGQPGWFEAMGLTPPDWVAYGRFPITIILALHYTPFVILLFGSALRRFDSQLEDSARILGARRYQVAIQIIMPLMRPALLSSMVLIFAKCLGEFGVPYVLGLPVKFEVLSTSLFRSIASRQTGVAGVVAASIMLIGIITLMIDARLVREARRFVTIGSKGSMNRQNRLGKLRLPATGFAAAVFILSVGMPLLTLVLSTVMKVPARFTFDNFTLDYWIGTNLHTVALQTGVLLSPDLWAAAKNTIAQPVGLSASGHFPAISGAGHCLCGGLSVAVCGAAWSHACALRHGDHPDTGSDCRSNALCFACRYFRHDTAGQGSRRGGTDCRCRLVPPHDLHRDPDPEGFTGHRRAAALHFGHQGPQPLRDPGGTEH
jgi:iron(III) transport system permease protein